MRHRWSSDRALGFVVGAAAMFFFVGGALTHDPINFLFALAFVGIGVFAPKAPGASDPS